MQKSKRVITLKIFFVLFAVLIIGRTLFIQLPRTSQLARLADRQFKSKVTALPRRGLIFDRNNQGLAITLNVHSLYMRPQVLKENTRPHQRVKIIQALAHILKQPESKFLAAVKSKKSFLWIKRQLSNHEEKLIRELDLDMYDDGLGLAEETKRFYPHRELAAHILGTVNIDGRGLEGIELYYDDLLTGERSRISSTKDAMGRSIFEDDQGILAFKNGQSLTLTIDKAIQYETEKILKATAQEFEARAGTAIIADVATGEILALANYPSFDPNNPKYASANAKRNRAITDIYEPGSTFKPFLIGMALEKGMPPSTQIFCERGKFRVGDRTISEAEAHEKFEWLSLAEILKFSSNIGAAKLALTLGPQTTAILLERLGIGSRTGIDLPGEVGGLTTKRQDLLQALHSPVRLANVGFGHGISVTPLQMLSYYLALANHGTWVQPKIVKTVTDDTKKTEHIFENQKIQNIFQTHTVATLTNMLETVVREGGTGNKAQLDEWPVAGKTGTAQKIDPITKRYSRNKYMASFIGFAPAKNPKLVGLVILDEPTKKYYAGDTAAPAFREIMRAALLKLQVPPLDSTRHNTQLANLLSIKALEQEVVDANSDHHITVEMNEARQIKLPDLRGSTIREALKIVGIYPLDVHVLGSGILKEQIPAAQEWLDPGNKIRLIFHP